MALNRETAEAVYADGMEKPYRSMRAGCLPLNGILVDR
jgi:hypothetical protein